MFIKDLIRNLILLAIIGFVLFLLFPDMMRMFFQLYNGLFGPVLIILIIIAAALPRRRRH